MNGHLQYTKKIFINLLTILILLKLNIFWCRCGLWMYLNFSQMIFFVIYSLERALPVEIFLLSFLPSSHMNQIILFILRISLCLTTSPTFGGAGRFRWILNIFLMICKIFIYDNKKMRKNEILLLASLFNATHSILCP